MLMYGFCRVMSAMHANPKDAVNIFVETQCKKAIGMHWGMWPPLRLSDIRIGDGLQSQRSRVTDSLIGTWVLTDEPVNEPPIKLREAMAEKGYEETGVFDVLNIGESREY